MARGASPALACARASAIWRAGRASAASRRSSSAMRAVRRPRAAWTSASCSRAAVSVGREADGALEGVFRLARLVQPAQADAQHVVRLGEAAVEFDRAGQRVERVAVAADEMPGDAEFVEDARGEIVELHRGAVVSGGALVAPPRRIHVAEELMDPRIGRIDRGCLVEVGGRGLQVAAAPLGLAALEVAEHRVRLEGNGAGEGGDRREMIAAPGFLVPLADVLPVEAFLPRDRIAVDEDPGGSGEQDGQEGLLHPAILPSAASKSVIGVKKCHDHRGKRGRVEPDAGTGF